MSKLCPFVAIEIPAELGILDSFMNLTFQYFFVTFFEWSLSGAKVMPERPNMESRTAKVKPKAPNMEPKV